MEEMEVQDNDPSELEAKVKLLENDGWVRSGEREQVHQQLEDPEAMMIAYHFQRMTRDRKE